MSFQNGLRQAGELQFNSFLTKLTSSALIRTSDRMEVRYFSFPARGLVRSDSSWIFPHLQNSVVVTSSCQPCIFESQEALIVDTFANSIDLLQFNSLYCVPSKTEIFTGAQALSTSPRGRFPKAQMAYIPELAY